MPFIQYRARAIGPVIKRSKNKGEVSPNSTTQQATLKYFKEVAQNPVPWAGYFKEISEILERSKVKTLDGQVIITGNGMKWSNVYSAALVSIPNTKETVMFTVTDHQNRWPGERLEYCIYLTNELPTIKYCTGKTPAIDNQTCPLCGTSGVTIFPNALSGAGINISNVDREGAFPGIDTGQAWKRYALCNACADLLYVYKFHFLKKDSEKRNPFITSIAGESAIVIPVAIVDYQARQGIWRGGINSQEKAYAFLLGVLYGKVLQVQGARGVNVGTNALTWLKRLTLKGRDLPELYIKTREKLLAYETEKSEDVRELIKEIGRLGVQLGDNIELEETPTNYYLLLGQSLTTTILPKKEEK